MVPISFNGCFGWLHPGTADYGVVLFSPDGEEERCVHHHWLNFAEELASAGFPTVRFDYHGTGDSLGDDETPGRVRAWIDSGLAAVKWIKEEIRVKAVALVGLRLGATLSVAASKELGGVDALVLLAPVLSGKSYIRELRLQMEFERERTTLRARQLQHGSERKIWRGGHGSDHDVEAFGFVYTGETQTDLKKMDLLDLSSLPAPRMLILKRGLNAEDRVAAKYRELGAQVFDERFVDYADFMKRPDEAKYPCSTFYKVVQWLNHHCLFSSVVSSRIPSTFQLNLPGCVEEPVSFGNHSSVFGVINRPRSVRPHSPVLLFLTTWGTSHIGIGRMWVMMARYFAGLGYVSFRFDLAGVGDSPNQKDYRAEEASIEHSIADVQSALDWLQSEGYAGFLLVGFCWGAALARAVSLRDNRLIGQILINLPSATFDTRHALRHYLSLARNFKYWWRILHGQVTIDYIFRRLATLREQRKSLRPHPQHKSEGEILDFLAAQEMGDLLKLRIETFLAYSAGESSIDQYQQSRNMKYANIHIVQFDHADHLFYQRSERRQLMELIRDYLGTLGPLESNKANKPDVNFTICDSSKIELSPFERTGSK